MVNLSAVDSGAGAAPFPQSRRQGKRIGVLWPADVETDKVRLPCVVLDISVAGAKLRGAAPLAGHLDKFWLNIDALGAFECSQVWDRDGRLGLRFVGDCPTALQLETLIHDPPYLHA
jgi:PilZ domain